MRQLAVIVALSSIIAGCASYYTSNGEKKYMKSHNGSRLVVPPPLTGGNLSEFYELPTQTQDPKVNIEAPSLES